MVTTYIGYASNKETRYKAASGGIISSIVEFLFSSGQIGTFLSCKFIRDKCCYEPKLIYSFKEYEMVGSVYQDMDISGYLRNHISKIKGTILIVCSPCLVRVVRHILTTANINAFIIDYFCSGQTTLEGTLCYYKFLGINKENVKSVRYRGGGWPSGIDITLNNGLHIKKANYTEPWVTIHESGFFTPKRCFYCKQVECKEADISIGDPWLKEYIETETIGRSLFLVHSQKGKNIINDLVLNKVITVKEVDYILFERSQWPTVVRKNNIGSEKLFYDLQWKLLNTNWYSIWAKKNLRNMKIHRRFVLYILHLYCRVKGMGIRKIILKFTIKMFGKIKQEGVRLYWKK